jgi:ubiquinol-cytochrome c reductase cytochrome c subunit
MINLAALLALIGLTNAMAQQPAAAAPPGNAKTGQTLYMKIGCYQCHGNQGQGGSSAGVRIAPAPMLPFRAFTMYIRAPRGEMPPYTAKVVSDENVADIYAYLAAIPAPPALDSIPLLKVEP